MRLFFLLIILFPFGLISQNRNDHVMTLNEIVELMNRAGRLNREYYNRSTEFCGNLCSNYKPEEWVSVIVQKEPLFKYYDRRDTLIPRLLTHKVLDELHPDEENQVYSYECDAIPYLLQRQKLKALIADTKTTLSPEVKANYIAFTDVVNELIALHYEMRIYTHTKQQVKDRDFKTAKQISTKFGYILEKYMSSSSLLWNCIEKDYTQHFPPLKTQEPILAAEKELMESLTLLYSWANDKFNNANASDSFHIKAIHSNINSALNKEQAYFQHTFGYNDKDLKHKKYFSSSIETPSQLYNHFYSITLNSIAKENVASTNIDFNTSDPSKKNYNLKIIHFNTAINAYNNFTTWADGKTVLNMMQRRYQEDTFTQGLDTNVNILLKRPVMTSYFNCLCISQNSLSLLTNPNNIPEYAGTSYSITSAPVAGSKQSDSLTIDKAQPHHLVYLLDASASMNEFGRLNHLKESAKYLVKLQREKDRISMVSFSTKANAILKNNPCNYKTEINSKIDLIQAAGGTNINDGMLKAFTLADSCKIVGGKNKILLITDGLFSMSKETLRLLKSFKDKQLELCIIYLGNSQSNTIEKEFKSICEKANGRFYNTNTILLKDVLLIEASE